eukprot:CAMPEP_0116870728 /NCGR_PEP_ID=MMETSP0463-20121206/771_1 /TAXON_ID=181622 /ORGANISM="Strombidinopsis sp, Strain SopsisLIS2011" /LENGTH=50 /DNA_ID=CAMNT_0004507825 /DNA_START=730 /DNA_END=879 /DNA_ORIENTATION=+
MALKDTDVGEDGDMDVMDPNVFCHMIMSNKIGGYGKEFFTDYFKKKKINK